MLELMLSHVQPFATLWTVARQASLSMGFSRQEYRSGLLCPPPGDLPDPEIELGSPALQAGSLPLSHQGSPRILLSHFSCVRLFVTLWTIARQAPLSMGFSRQEYWSELPSLLPEDPA